MATLAPADRGLVDVVLVLASADEPTCGGEELRSVGSGWDGVWVAEAVVVGVGAVNMMTFCVTDCDATGVVRVQSSLADASVLQV